jgi:undecaprenyl diphosphate synthase
VIKDNIDKAKLLALKTSGLNLPISLLIIPDGNGRWAKHAGLAISEGHKMGGVTFSRVLKHFVNVNIDVLGAWGFSEDNWKREKQEIDNIMGVIENMARQNLDFMIKNNIKFLVLGKRERIKLEYPTLVDAIEEAELKTAQNSGKTLVIFIDFGERYQLEEFAKARELDTTSTTYELIFKINKGIPLFDMVLRTSGELRLSGFGPLASLAEFVSVKKNLPDLSDNDIIKALSEYSSRQRRFGGR